MWKPHNPKTISDASQCNTSSILLIKFRKSCLYMAKLGVKGRYRISTITQTTKPRFQNRGITSKHDSMENIEVFQKYTSFKGSYEVNISILHCSHLTYIQRSFVFLCDVFETTMRYRRRNLRRTTPIKIFMQLKKKDRIYVNKYVYMETLSTLKCGFQTVLKYQAYLISDFWNLSVS